MQRGKDKSYALTPIAKDDLYFNADIVKKIKKSIAQAKKGKITTISSSKEIKELLGLWAKTFEDEKLDPPASYNMILDPWWSSFVTA